jgi:endonuclease YncB( thermonuclease family)
MIRVLMVLAMTICAARAAPGENSGQNQISGQGKAIDSVILQINDQRVMLFGIDSVMRKQHCLLDGKPWECWLAAVQDLQSLLDQGPVTCAVVGEPDIYGRVLGRCSVNGRSINEQLVNRGFAVARPSDTTEYVAAEAAAKDRKVGLWQGQFVRPKEFRRAAGIAVDRP